MLTHCAKRKQAIYQLESAPRAHQGGLRLILGASVASPLSIISGTICNDTHACWHKHAAHWLDASLHYPPSDSMRRGSVPARSSPSGVTPIAKLSH